MSLLTDQLYAGMLAPYVRNFTRKAKAFNFSCPICGDSQTHASKARGYLFPSGDRLVYMCHNCNTPVRTLHGLLMQVDPNLAGQYKTDIFIEGKRERPAAVLPAMALTKSSIHPSLQKISTLPQTHFAKKYVQDRQIPSDKHYLLYFTDAFKAFCNKVDPLTFEEIVEDEPRLVIPLFDKDGNVNGYQGRSFDPFHQLKYMTVLTHESNPKLFGLERLDPNMQTIVFEGPIDALFIDNSIATCGGRLDTGLQEHGISPDRCVVVYDNEPRSIFTVRKMRKAIDSGYKVCFWPQNVAGDVNQMILDGVTRQEIREIILANSYSGLRASLEMTRWKKI